MEPRYKIVYITLGLVAASMLGDVAAYGQASIERPYDGEWLAKVSCTESIYRRPPFTYQATIPVEKGRIQKTFQNTQGNTITTNTWTGSFTSNELKIEINGSNSNGEKWRYLLKGELNSPYAVSLTGPYFDARGNQSRTCNIAFNSTKPDELRQAAQRAEQETARLKQELAQKDQALAAAQASTAAVRTQAQQELSQEAQAVIDAQRQAAQRAEQETARLKQELVQKEQALAAAQASAVAARTQAQQGLSQEAQAAIDAQRQAAQRAEQETARLKQELVQKEQALAAAQASAVAARTQAQQGLSQEAQAVIDAQRQAAQRAEQETARLKEELVQKEQALAAAQASALSERNQLQQLASQQAEAAANVQRQAGQKFALEIAQLRTELSQISSEIGTLTETEAQRRNDLERTLRQEAQNSITAKQNEVQRLASELADVKAQLSKTNPQIEAIYEAESSRRRELEKQLRQESQSTIDAQRETAQQRQQEIEQLKQELAQKTQALTTAQADMAIQRTLAQQAQFAGDAQRLNAQNLEQEIVRLKQELSQKDQSMLTAKDPAPAQRPQEQRSALQDRLITTQTQTQNAQPSPSQTATKAKSTIKLQELTLELGQAKLLGKANVELGGDENFLASGEFKLNGFEQLQKQANASSDKAPKMFLAMLKGYGEVTSENITWRIAITDKKLTVNNQDLTAMLGAEIARTGSDLGNLVIAVKQIFNLLPDSSRTETEFRIEGNLDITDAADLVGKIEFRMVGFDQIQKLLGQIQNARELGPALAMLKGFSETKGNETIWRLEFNKTQVKVNGSLVSGTSENIQAPTTQILSESQTQRSLRNDGLTEKAITSSGSLISKDPLDKIQIDFGTASIFTIAIIIGIYWMVPRVKSKINRKFISYYRWAKVRYKISIKKRQTVEEKKSRLAIIMSEWREKYPKFTKTSFKLLHSIGVFTRLHLRALEIMKIFWKIIKPDYGQKIKGIKISNFHLAAVVSTLAIIIYCIIPSKNSPPSSSQKVEYRSTSDERFENLQNGKTIILQNFEQPHFNYPWDTQKSQSRVLFQKPLNNNKMRLCGSNEVESKLIKGVFEELNYFYSSSFRNPNIIYCLHHQVQFSSTRSRDGTYLTFFPDENSLFLFTTTSAADRPQQLMIAGNNITVLATNKGQRQFLHFKGAIEQWGNNINLVPEKIICRVDTTKLDTQKMMFTGEDVAYLGPC